MFTKILIANRGEIACRVVATARRLGVRTVAVYSEADAHAQHVLQADEAVPIGAAPARESYLQWQRIVEAALATGAQAIHPGYGFLSENEDFARACAAAGLVFIGPPPAAIAAMGSKSAAKALMGTAGVPLVPGYHGADNAPDFLAAQAGLIGYPVLIKASAGGGGKGMRRVDRAEDFAAALASCQREAQNSFGDQHVLIERYVTRPRHIEIQVFGDQHGNVIHLNERDCSVQRRHQKVLEESPAPGLSAARRKQMGAAAVAAAKAVAYVGAGTVEFIAEPKEGGAAGAGSGRGDGSDGGPSGDLHFYFMEMNTRLQVEHPVTEAVTGLDLVEWQLRVAAGEPLPLTQEQVPTYGHAIEARICAESPERDFLPGSGHLQVARWPAHVRFARSYSLPRLDSGFVEGDTVSPHYDSMIAKLIVWGEDRAQALARLDSALAQTHLVGLPTNVAFLRRVVNTRAFATADLDTALIERERTALFEAPPLAREWVAAAVAVHGWATQANETARADPWSRRDGWRLHGAARRHLQWQVGDSALNVVLERQADGGSVLELDGQRWPVSYQVRAAEGAARSEASLHSDGSVRSEGRYDIQLGAQRLTLDVYAHGDRLTIFAPAASAAVTKVDPLAQTGAARAGGGLTAPMPGKVVSFAVQAGDAVRRGQPVAVMEAMKMEHTLTAPRDGVVQALLFAAGEQVPEGAELLCLVAAEAEAKAKAA